MRAFRGELLDDDQAVYSQCHRTTRMRASRKLPCDAFVSGAAAPGREVSSNQKSIRRRMVRDGDPAAHQLDQFAANRQARPVPPKRRVTEPSACWNLSNSRSLASAVTPTPLSCTSTLTRVRPPGNACDLASIATKAALGELHRVGHQV